VSVFGGTQGGKTGILAPFQPLVEAESSTYPVFPDSFRMLLQVSVGADGAADQVRNG
jgi:cephalosporin-C deacetylase-like acetyl esterase